VKRVGRKSLSYRYDVVCDSVPVKVSEVTNVLSYVNVIDSPDFVALPSFEPQR